MMDLLLLAVIVVWFILTVINYRGQKQMSKEIDALCAIIDRLLDEREERAKEGTSP